MAGGLMIPTIMIENYHLHPIVHEALWKLREIGLVGYIGSSRIPECGSLAKAADINFFEHLFVPAVHMFYLYESSLHKDASERSETQTFVRLAQQYGIDTEDSDHYQTVEPLDVPYPDDLDKMVPYLLAKVWEVWDRRPAQYRRRELMGQLSHL